MGRGAVYILTGIFPLSTSTGQLQILYAGKAHPADEQGKAIIKEIYQASRQLNGNIKMAYIPNYEMYRAKFLVAGVDVWLNTPLRPMEASGTSGMKAARFFNWTRSHYSECVVNIISGIMVLLDLQGCFAQIPQLVARPARSLGFGRSDLALCCRLASTNASKRANICGSVAVRLSGCHCTPTIKGAVVCSMPSITPSGAWAVTTNPGARSLTAW